MNQQIRICNTCDGVRIACCTAGEGLLLVKANHWIQELL